MSCLQAGAAFQPCRLVGDFQIELLAQRLLHRTGRYRGSVGRRHPRTPGARHLIDDAEASSTWFSRWSTAARSNDIVICWHRQQTRITQLVPHIEVRHLTDRSASAFATDFLKDGGMFRDQRFRLLAQILATSLTRSESVARDFFQNGERRRCRR